MLATLFAMSDPGLEINSFCTGQLRDALVIRSETGMVLPHLNLFQQADVDTSVVLFRNSLPRLPIKSLSLSGTE